MPTTRAALVLTSAGLGLSIAALIAVLLADHPDVASFHPMPPVPLPPLNGSINSNNRLPLASGGVFGLEGVACTSRSSHILNGGVEKLQQWCVGGAADGWLVRLTPAGTEGEEGSGARPSDLAEGADAAPWVYVGGRPLGIHIHSHEGVEEVWVCEAVRGLLRVDVATGRVDIVAALGGDGRPVRYANDLDVGSNGDVYFSDSTSLPPRFHPGDDGGRGLWSTLQTALTDIASGVGRGRLLRWVRASGRVEVLVGGLHYGNGVALARDESYVLVVETGQYRVLRHWLRGPNVGQTDVFADALPGFPDGLSRSRHRPGSYWLSLIAGRNPVLDLIHPYPLLKRLAQVLPSRLKQTPVWGAVLRLDDGGRVVESYAGSGVQVTSAWEGGRAEEKGGAWLLLGNLYGRFLTLIRTA